MTAIDLIQSLRRELEKPFDDFAIRAEIVELIHGNLNARKHAFGDWEKVHFSTAITSLTLSIHELTPASHKWLALCLDNLEKACIPPPLRNSSDCLPDGSVRKARYKQFVDALECLRADLGVVSMPRVKFA